MKNVKQLGKLGEYLVMIELLKQNIEAYPSNIKNQENWDITIILNDKFVKRIQVKTTSLQNASTNNSLQGTEKNYDFLVIVIQDTDKYSFLVLGKDEVIQEKGDNIDFPVSQNKDGVYVVRENLKKYQDRWEPDCLPIVSIIPLFITNKNQKS